MSKHIIDQCPHCQAAWGFEEIEFEECYSCGWPNVQDDDIDQHGADVDDWEWDEEDFETGSLDY